MRMWCAAPWQATAAAFEDMQSQNARLLQQLADREEAMNAAIADRLKVLHVLCLSLWCYCPPACLAGRGGAGWGGAGVVRRRDLQQQPASLLLAPA